MLDITNVGQTTGIEVKSDASNWGKFGYALSSASCMLMRSRVTSEAERRNGFCLLVEEPITTEDNAAGIRPRLSRRYPANDMGSKFGVYLFCELFIPGKGFRAEDLMFENNNLSGAFALSWLTCLSLELRVPVLVGLVCYLLLSKPVKGVEKSFALLSLLGKIIPVYKEVLAELKAVGATWVQIDEPTLVMDLDYHKLKAFTEAYEHLEDALSGFSVIIETYFADLLAEAYKTIISLKGVFAIGLDLVRGDKTLELKILEVNALAKALASEKDEAFFSANAASQASRKSSPRVNDEAVQKAASTIRESEHRRGTPVTARLDAQQKDLNLSILPTMTIGSFPQTPNLHRVRREYKGNKISEEEYIKAMKKEISKVVKLQEDLDIDRKDMVEYFGEQLKGFAFSANGWVQSYGSRCVKPPIIYGADIPRVTDTSRVQRISKDNLRERACKEQVLHLTFYTRHKIDMLPHLLICFI
ncbi:hypothetical protein GIB67_019116 [Kingdonia uniflora]|uniref:5-methyltetrahydropteroyltriglutamate--homocysteine S-methyltransferase n=1 Tax=Kingdonia uniflora TaxID=39325 RepID=A0A7J7MZT8_9MAGN|nr:hypothetical protein GIB67_019116 [Kingdonia uniflora]